MAVLLFCAPSAVGVSRGRHENAYRRAKQERLYNEWSVPRADEMPGKQLAIRSGFEESLVRECSFERWLHLHLLELGDGEVEVRLGLGLLCVAASEE